MSTYTAIIIIYNPHSTGSSQKVATDLKQTLEKALPRQHIKLLATKYAGHAEKLAYRHAKATRSPLILSASGDGGYHEIINGVMQARSEGANPVAGLVPTGNANDHFHSVHSGDFITAITEGTDRAIDVLKFTGVHATKPFERYAHSYIGLGLSPKVGTELNKTDLNRIKETWITLKTIATLRHTRLIVQGQVRSYDSLVLTNVGRMGKVLNLAKEADVTDGMFEVSAIYHKNVATLLLSLLRASTVGAQSLEQTREYTFETIAATAVQLDGEVHMLDAQSKAVVTIDHNALRCIV